MINFVFINNIKKTNELVSLYHYQAKFLLGGTDIVEFYSLNFKYKYCCRSFSSFKSVCFANSDHNNKIIYAE